MPNLTGQTIGQYRVLEQIGRGGMAIIYKAFQPSMERHIAIKILPAHFAQDPTFLDLYTATEHNFNFYWTQIKGIPEK